MVETYVVQVVQTSFQAWLVHKNRQTGIEGSYAHSNTVSGTVHPTTRERPIKSTDSVYGSPTYASSTHMYHAADISVTQHPNPIHVSSITTTQLTYDPPDGESSSDDDDKLHPPTRREQRRPATSRIDDEVFPAKFQTNHNINGLIRGYQGHKKYNGAWDQDRDGCSAIFDATANVCGVTHVKQLQDIPAMLAEDALRYFSDNANKCLTYQDGPSLLRTWYHHPTNKAGSYQRGKRLCSLPPL